MAVVRVRYLHGMAHNSVPIFGCSDIYLNIINTSDDTIISSSNRS